MDKRFLSLLTMFLRRPANGLNILAAVAQRRKLPLRPGFLPYVLDIEPTSYCNFKCTMCHVSDPDFEHAHMPLDLFKQIVDSNPQLAKIHLQGMGEPLLCPDFFNMVNYARKRKILVQTTINGSLLTEQNAAALATHNLASIGVSVDGATAQTFESIRRGSHFAKVTDGIRRLAKALKASGAQSKLRAWTVVQKDNAGELADIVRLCHELGCHELVFQTNLSDWGKSEWQCTSKMSATGEILTNALDLAFNEGKKLDFPVRRFDGDRYTKEKPCLWPWHSAFIDSRGHVVPCCILGDYRVCSFGSLSDTTLKTAWSGKDWSNFRRAHRDHTIPSFCHNCYKDK